jgi:hypothetical protein
MPTKAASAAECKLHRHENYDRYSGLLQLHRYDELWPLLLIGQQCRALGCILVVALADAAFILLFGASAVVI